MLSAISLLVNKLPDSLITATINPFREFCLIRRKTPAFRPQKPFAVNRLLIMVNVRVTSFHRHPTRFGYDQASSSLRSPRADVQWSMINGQWAKLFLMFFS